MIPRRLRIELLLLLLFGCCVGAGDFRGTLPLKRALIPLAADEGEIGEIRFDSTLYREVDDPFAHVRLYDSDDIEVPFQVRKADRISGSRTVWQPVRSQIRSFEQDDARAVLTVANPDRERVSRLRLISPDRDFRKQITIEAGDGKLAWKTIAGPLPFYDYTSQVDLHQDSAEFAENDSPYFRIVIDRYRESKPDASQRITERPDGRKHTERTWRETQLRIDGAVLSRSRSEPTYETLRTDWPLRTTERREGSRTIVDLHSGREPLTRLTVSSATRDYKRNIVLYSCDGAGQTLRELARGVVSSLNGDAGRQLMIPESRYSRYRLEIENGDNRPLESLRIQGSGPVHRIQFLTRDAPRNLCYGAALPTPSYDIGAVLSQIEPQTVSSYALAEPSPNPVCREKAQVPTPLLFSGVIVLLTGVLGWFLWTGLKKMRE